MKVDKNNVRDIVDEHDRIVEQLMYIGSFIPWDLPPVVEKCRQKRYDMLMRKLERLVETDEAKDYGLFVDYYKY